MTTAEVVRSLTASIGRKVLITPCGSTPEQLFIVDVDCGVDGECFYYNILTDPTVYDPNITHSCFFDDVHDVQPC